MQLIKTSEIETVVFDVFVTGGIKASVAHYTYSQKNSKLNAGHFYITKVKAKGTRETVQGVEHLPNMCGVLN